MHLSIANAVNSYANINGIPGTGPYFMKTIGSSMSTITLKNTPNYWGAFNPFTADVLYDIIL